LFVITALTQYSPKGSQEMIKMNASADSNVTHICHVVQEYLFSSVDSVDRKIFSNFNVKNMRFIF
jgi:hypothetical protein